MSKEKDEAAGGTPPRVRSALAQGFTWVEDIMYVGLGALLSLAALVLLGSTALAFWRGVWETPLSGAIIGVLDRVLLMMMIVEILYTVQLSFREHALVPEPFLVVGLVAAIRRILVLTAELTQPERLASEIFRLAMIELGVLTAMIVAFVASLLMIRRRSPNAVATKA